MMMVALYWNALSDPCDYLPEFSLRYNVEIQRPLTRSLAVAALGFVFARS